MSGQIEGSSLMQGCSWSGDGYTLVLRNVLLADGKLYHLRIERDTPITDGIAEDVLPVIEAICQRSIFGGVNNPASYVFEHTSGDNQSRVYFGGHQVENWTNQPELQDGFRQLNGLLDAAVLTNEAAQDGVIEEEAVLEQEQPPISAPSKHAARRFPSADLDSDSESERAAPLPARQPVPPQPEAGGFEADDEGDDGSEEEPVLSQPAPASLPSQAPAIALAPLEPAAAPAPQEQPAPAEEPIVGELNLHTENFRHGLGELLRNPNSAQQQRLKRWLIDQARAAYNSTYRSENIEPSEIPPDYSGKVDLYRATLAARWIIANVARGQSNNFNPNLLVANMAQEIIASDLK